MLVGQAVSESTGIYSLVIALLTFIRCLIYTPAYGSERTKEDSIFIAENNGLNTIDTLN